nr:hypothetical protein [uncultured Roseovarius sp.]
MTARLTDQFPPRRGRTHEVQGPGAIGFALALAGRLGGVVLWVMQGWQGRQLNPVGAAEYLDPQRLLIARTRDEAETLAVAEEALRAGAVTLVVMELTQPLGLTPGRRLQLAAETGRSTGLCLMPEGMGSNAAETRWYTAPVFDAADSTLMRWEITKNKSGTLAAWDVRWDAETHRVIVVSEAGERPGVAGAAG